MQLSAYICRTSDPHRMNAAEAFLTDLGQGVATTVADRSAIAPIVAGALGLPAGSERRVAIDPGGVTLLHRAGGPCMVNVTPTDPLRARVSSRQRLYLVRHGEADTPSADGHVHSWAPLPLTARGRRQAQSLGRAFAAVAMAAVHASDIARTVETAELIAGSRAPVRLEPRLRELSLGELEGAHADDILATEPGFLSDPDAALPGGESMRDVSRRVGPVLDAIAVAERGAAVLVAHGGVNRALLSRLLDLPLERAMLLRQDWAGVNVLERTADGWVIGTLNWTPEGTAEPAHVHRTRHLHERVRATGGGSA